MKPVGATVRGIIGICFKDDDVGIENLTSVGGPLMNELWELTMNNEIFI